MLAAVAARHTPLPLAPLADLFALHCGAGCRWDAHVSVANEWVPKLPALTVDQADTLRKLAAQGTVTANSRLASQVCARLGPAPTYGCSFGSRRVCGRHNATTAGAAGSGAEHARVRRRAAAPVQHAVERDTALRYTASSAASNPGIGKRAANASTSARSAATPACPSSPARKSLSALPCAACTSQHRATARARKPATACSREPQRASSTGVRKRR